MENNIVHDAYYLVILFHKKGKEITQLHIQKLMFLFEAYYMNKYKVEKLYDCDYQAWDFGPVAIPLYKNFKKYGKSNIILTTEEEEIGNKTNDEVKETMEDLYEGFGHLTAMQLVNFTHAEKSPWYEAWNYQKYSKIPKSKIKAWFKKYIKNE